MAAPRKYGNAAIYKEVRATQAKIRKLEKRGVVKAGSSEKVTVSKTGKVTTTRSVKDALADFHAALHGKGQIRKLTPAQAKQIKSAYADLPENMRPTIKNNRVLVEKGISLRTSGGEARLEYTSASKRFKNTFFLKKGWEADVRKIMERNPGRRFYFEFNDDIGGNPQLRQEGWGATPRGISDMIKFINAQYIDGKGVANKGLRGRLVMQEALIQQEDERDANMAKKKKARAKKNYQHKKARKTAAQNEAERKKHQAQDRARRRARSKKN